MESQVPPLGNKNAGTIEMVFDTNSEWEACITSSSFKNGCYIDGQSQGKGRGVIIIKYGKAESGCDCDESATITITYVDRIDKDGENIMIVIHIVYGAIIVIYVHKPSKCPKLNTR